VQSSIRLAVVCVMQKVFEALASAQRRAILTYVSQADMTAGEIASRFDVSRSATSQHLGILEEAGLIRGEKRGPFMVYTLLADNLSRPLLGFVEDCGRDFPAQ